MRAAYEQRVEARGTQPRCEISLHGRPHSESAVDPNRSYAAVRITPAPGQPDRMATPALTGINSVHAPSRDTAGPHCWAPWQRLPY